MIGSHASSLAVKTSDDNPKNVLDVPIKLLSEDKEKSLREHTSTEVKAILFVNVASKWGLTNNDYKQLVQMYENHNQSGL